MHHQMSHCVQMKVIVATAKAIANSIHVSDHKSPKF